MFNKYCSNFFRRKKLSNEMSSRSTNCVLALIFVGLSVSSSACNRKPTPVKTAQEDIPNLMGSGGLWVSTTNFSSGFLGRLDLASGEVKSELVLTGPDSIPVAVSSASSGFLEKDLYLLTRSQNDSVQKINFSKTSSSAFVEKDLALPKGFNPQSIAQDAIGRLWVVGYGSDEVQVLSPSQTSPASTISLRSWNENPSDPKETAELNQVMYVPGADEIWISAQRLTRGLTGWVPNQFSGLSVISSERLELIKEFEISVPNLLRFWAVDGFFTGFGAGNLAEPESESAAAKAVYVQSQVALSPVLGGRESMLLSQRMEYSGRIVDAARCEDGSTVRIEWNPKEQQSCALDSEGKSHFCSRGSEGSLGYGLAQVVCLQDYYILVENLGLESELLFVSRKQNTVTRRKWPRLVTALAVGP